jgi:hypothetical protein
MEAESITYINTIEGYLGYGISNTKKNAIDNFIVLEKAANRWNGYHNIWITAWGNKNANSVCLKNGVIVGNYPRGATHATGYVQGDGVRQYFNTGSLASSIFNVNSSHVFTLAVSSPNSGSIFGVGGVLVLTMEDAVDGNINIDGNMGQGYIYTSTDAVDGGLNIEGNLGQGYIYTSTDAVSATLSIKGT